MNSYHVMQVFVFVSVFKGVEASGIQTRTLYVEKGPQGCDSYRKNHVHEKKMFDVIWRKGHTPPLYCKFGFDGHGSDGMDKYKVCAEPVDTVIKDCSVHIRYYFGHSNVPNVTYGCMSNITKECAGESERFDIGIDSTNDYMDLNDYLTSMTLRVTAIKTYDYKDSVMDIVTTAGIVLGIIFGVTLLVVIGVVILATRKGQNVGQNWRKKSIKKSLHYNPTGNDIPYGESSFPQRRGMLSENRRNRGRKGRANAYTPSPDITITESSQDMLPPTLRWRPDAPPSYEEAISRNIPNTDK